MKVNKPVLVTGAAGFIGFHLAKRLLQDGKSVVGYDNVNDYYDVALKEARLEELKKFPEFKFIKADLKDLNTLEEAFREYGFEVIINMAAQAGVRYSLTNPHAYVDSNIVGFVNLLECCRNFKAKHLVFASSSSVYGANTKMPFSIHDNVDHPISLYAATKKANELMAHTYAYLYNLPCTGLRFFTVYGPWGRPDMALFKFTKAILARKPIEVYNHGDMERDFTYIDDIVEGVLRVAERIPEPNPQWTGDKPDPGTSMSPFKVYNIGNHQPIKLMSLIEILEDALGQKAEKEMLPMQPGDVPATYADVVDLTEDVGFAPATPISHGVKEFVQWYRDYTEKS